MNVQVLKVLDNIRQSLVEGREEGAIVSPMQALLDECSCQDKSEDEEAEVEAKAAKPKRKRWNRVKS